MVEMTYYVHGRNNMLREVQSKVFLAVDSRDLYKGFD